MADCALCHFKGNILFEEAGIVAALPQNPLVPGHAVVFPKQHLKILEQVPDDVIGPLFEVANKVSSAMFEALKAQGTNIIVMSGPAAGQHIPHIAVDVIPRSRDDGLSFTWPAKKLPDDQMSIVEQEMKTQAMGIGIASKDEPVEGSEPGHVNESHAGKDEPDEPAHGKREENSQSPADEEEENPFRRQLRRLP